MTSNFLDAWTQGHNDGFGTGYVTALGDVKTAIQRLQEELPPPPVDTRPCTCHPSEAPNPCPRKFDCLAAAADLSLLEEVSAALSYSHNFATAKPDIGETAKEHILGLCKLVEKLARHIESPPGLGYVGRKIAMHTVYGDEGGISELEAIITQAKRYNTLMLSDHPTLGVLRRAERKTVWEAPEGLPARWEHMSCEAGTERPAYIISNPKDVAAIDAAMGLPAARQEPPHV